MSNDDLPSKETLCDLFAKKILEIESEKNFLQKQIQERDLRIQIYQFSDDKLSELRKNLKLHQNLSEIWSEFEVAYKLITGTNLIQFTELEEKKEEYQKKIDNL